MKKKLFVTMILFAIIFSLASCSSDEYWCDICHETYDDGEPHHVLEGQIDMTLCGSCYNKLLEEN